MREFLLRHEAAQVELIGGTAAISADVAAELEGLAEVAAPGSADPAALPGVALTDRSDARVFLDGHEVAITTAREVAR